MDTTLDGLAAEVARLAGGGEIGPLPAGPHAEYVLEGMPVDRLARVVRTGSLEVVVFSVPPGWRGGRKGGDPSALPVGEQAAEISRGVSRLLFEALPRRDWGRIALVRLEEGRPQPDALASAVTLDPSGVMKFAFPASEPVAEVVSRVPVLAPLWDAAPPASPSWLGRVRAEGGLGPLSEVDLDLRPGPGLTVLHGPRNTGKTLLLRCLGAALRGEGPLEAGFVGGPPALPGAAAVPDEAMRPWRRMIGYGDPSGRLLFPLEIEGGGAQAAERLGSGLLRAVAAGDEPGGWPGALVDAPTTGLDDVRRVKALEAVVRLAADRQVVVALRDDQEFRLAERIAAERGVSFDGTDLGEGTALLRAAPRAPSPGR